MSAACQGYVKVMTGSSKLGIIGIVKFTRRLETEGFSVLFTNVVIRFYFKKS